MHLAPDDSVAWVVVRQTKTIQYFERELRIPLVAIPGSDLCPVRALRRLFAAVPAPPVAHAFSYMSPRGARLHLTHQVFVARFKSLLRKSSYCMSEHSASESEGGSGWSAPPSPGDEEEKWYRISNCNWEQTLSGGFRAIRPEGPPSFPVCVYLLMWNITTHQQEIDTCAAVNKEGTIFDVEWKLGLHRSGVCLGRLACPVSREDLISWGEDPDQPGRNDGDRVFRKPDLRVADLQEYFIDNQLFRIVWL
ncbi:hypothetical protein KFL_002340160 [Klebsormidium nitens]|uniref:Uncharacterized protein n=1 Tax=Klebsormidium nitens TaxID=105231 RepID=A0A1Y1I9Q7_KLENI|nr:hypothetical protein KFL_002340160 [Klebsormidium nitens]|eukprot:GAQ85426.1 hypothetical protein KFL_002340160 [Klebsormidium nitens]